MIQEEGQYEYAAYQQATLRAKKKTASNPRFWFSRSTAKPGATKWDMPVAHLCRYAKRFQRGRALDLGKYIEKCVAGTTSYGIVGILVDAVKVSPAGAVVSCFLGILAP